MTSPTPAEPVETPAEPVEAPAEPVEALVLDLDDTLFDHTGSARDALAAWLPGLGAEATPELVDFWFRVEEVHFESWRSGRISFAEQRRRRLRDLLPVLGHPVGTDDELDATFEGFRSRYQACWRPFPDVHPTLARWWRRVPIAVLTNGSDVQQRAKVAAIGATPYLVDVFTAEALGTPKPDPRSYRTVCAALGVPPERVLHVGDRYDLDVVAARAAGLQAVHLDRSGTGPDPDAVRSLTALHPPAPEVDRGSAAASR
ncbi:putative hydrolase of the HAD superfamily [Friedmanniella endophytica]|uniref:Putative hydrolase of the HAD superfamily n=1 Tax=Microlunatus kandeliicorticis TaxID=1759536 RepID=A0A7W3IR83_9ACTN|nr:HAD family hydrolase [Microlunatus kandeliicorticis]MBA8793757.1 putative hydrolase of the HAD superfamily [Microlunatus kandeliicorticis]